ncbi:MAG TPA: sugar ABC transporter ATP-binding protein [Armatimonadota bacterium]|nr:sugar ABC transporter ATP-binding protein [Armatimonadota bacterium]
MENTAPGERRPALLLQMKGITKRFPGVTALDRVDFELYPQEICGLIGENGAGKSTLIRILAGIFPADEGEILLDSRPVRISSVQDSLALGISAIHQELNLAGNLDIASNILLGREPAVTPLRLVQHRRLMEQAGEVARTVGITAALTTSVERLSPGQQQLVEIAKALSMSARILVLDEPTSSLSPREAATLFSLMRRLREQGVSMIYISHRLAEVEEICGRAVVLRDGRRVGELDRGRMRRDDMVRLMVGRDISRFFPDAGKTRGQPALEVHNLRPPGCLGQFNFSVNEGEILGVAGLVGAGRTELARCLFGIEPVRADSGEILISGRPVEIGSPLDAIRHGMGMVPEDRKYLGVILGMALKENVSLPKFCYSGRRMLDSRAEAELAERQVHALDIRTPSISQNVEFLSGGNQQKVALAKWLALEPRILILDEPTRGIDVGSKSEVYNLIRRLADSGVAVIMISSEMEEILGLADRALVLHEGRQKGILSHDEMTEESIMRLATGGTE